MAAPRSSSRPPPASAGSSSGGAFLTEVDGIVAKEKTSKRPPDQALQLQAASAAKHKEDKVKSAKIKKEFLDKHCRGEVSEEWKKVDDKKIAKLRGILAALQEENQSTQLLKKESENKTAKQELDATRASVQQRLAMVKDKESLFKHREADLRAHIQENEKAIHELETNIAKGEKKASDELAECRRLDKEIEQLLQERRDNEAVKEDELKKISQFTKYKQFLEVVVQECDAEFEGDIEVLINRHNTLESGNKELHQANKFLTSRLDRVREECLRVQTKLQNDHLRISSQLHECQVNLDKHRAESQDLESKLIRALEDKELKESKVGVIQMAIEQLFTRTLASLKLNQKQLKRTQVEDVKFKPILGDKNDVKLDEMLRQIVERMEDLQEILAEADKTLRSDDAREEVRAVEVEAEIKVQWVTQANSGDGMLGADLGNSEMLTAGGSKRLQSDTSGGSGNSHNLQAGFSKEMAGRVDDGHEALFAE